jgi:hypothetical protein
MSSLRLAIFCSEALGFTFWHATGKHTIFFIQYQVVVYNKKQKVESNFRLASFITEKVA